MITAYSVRRALAGALLLPLLGALPAVAAKDERGEAELARILAGRVAGKPVDCISLPLARSSRVVDHTAIVYEAGRTLYVNRPRSGAETLDQDDILVTSTTGSQLCRLDIVRLVDRASRVPSGFVGLDTFVPYTRPPAPKR